MPVKIGDFVSRTDFVVLDVIEDSNIPLILVRPYLNSADTIIHVAKKLFDVGVGEKRAVFYVGEPKQGCYAIRVYGRNDREVLSPSQSECRI